MMHYQDAYLKWNMYMFFLGEVRGMICIKLSMFCKLKKELLTT